MQWEGGAGGGWSSSADIFMLSLLDNPVLYRVVNIRKQNESESVVAFRCCRMDQGT